MQIRGLHFYTGKGYKLNPVPRAKLDEFASTGIFDYIVHMGQPDQVCFKHTQSAAERTAVVTQSINDFKAFLNQWKDSRIDSKRMWVTIPILNVSKSDQITFTKAYDFLSYCKSFIDQASTAIRNTLGDNFWDDDFEGFNFRLEMIHPVSTKISRTNPTENPTVKLMNSLSAYIRDMGKQFMWCPYYGYGDFPENITYNIGVIANRTNIFDHILIQPAYYFQDGNGCDKTNLSGVYQSVRDQEVQDLDYNPIAGGRASNATAAIGVVMEADDYAVVSGDSGKKARFQEYLTKFDTFVNEAPPIAFYAGPPSNILDYNKALLNQIESFYKDNK